MGDVIEKIRSAIFSVEAESDGMTPAEFNNAVARAALAAVLEDMETPSAAMCEVGDDGYYGMSPDDVWQAMLAQYRKENLDG